MIKNLKSLEKVCSGFTSFAMNIYLTFQYLHKLYLFTESCFCLILKLFVLCYILHFLRTLSTENKNFCRKYQAFGTQYIMFTFSKSTNRFLQISHDSILHKREWICRHDIWNSSKRRLSDIKYPTRSISWIFRFSEVIKIWEIFHFHRRRRSRKIPFRFKFNYKK